MVLAMALTEGVANDWLARGDGRRVRRPGLARRRGVRALRHRDDRRTGHAARCCSTPRAGPRCSGAAWPSPPSGCCCVVLGGSPLLVVLGDRAVGAGRLAGLPGRDERRRGRPGPRRRPGQRRVHDRLHRLPRRAAAARLPRQPRRRAARAPGGLGGPGALGVRRARRARDADGTEPDGLERAGRRFDADERRPQQILTADPELDEERRRGLRRMRTLAVSLLLFAARGLPRHARPGRLPGATSTPAPRRRWSARSRTGSR